MARQRQTARRGGFFPVQTARRLVAPSPSPIDRGAALGKRKRTEVYYGEAENEDEEAETENAKSEDDNPPKQKTKKLQSPMKVNANAAGPSSSSTYSYYSRYSGPRPHPQEQSPFLSLPAELLDRILADRVLNERDHLALSGVCTALRLGYDEEVWNATLHIHTPFSHNQFTYRLLHDPCNIASGITADESNSSRIPAVAHIWTRAIGRVNDKSVRPGIDFNGPCYKIKHKKCKCMRLMGQSHAKVISNVNLKKTSWGHIFYHYQGLSEFVDHADFECESKVNTRGDRTNMYCLAEVDAAILRNVGGVWAAARVRKSEEGKKRRRAPKDRDW